MLQKIYSIYSTFLIFRLSVNDSNNVGNRYVAIESIKFSNFASLIGNLRLTALKYVLDYA
jgi:hypothetical protein